ncbi:glycerophosphodiester phosphodiesterase [[Clostridium] polysaccharolyticum]|uniref:Glycerophosphoryl diester phosphodiesterase n=1 Tax=[Clostridium] polysaccharolyticum TaxID=29364 RepID=A0A1I0FNN1_9FIRM|nr:glycerophosphodiester phosphodiesterase [[Clostridium] polysaccharolyticum]SET58907.1 glycerophosphoryl diester phosphodiesterase [[Clostridium] polysaccharolyticum]
MRVKDKKRQKKLLLSTRKTLFGRTLRLMIKSKKHFLLFQILYGILAILCIVPSAGVMFGLAGKYSGYSYITTENMADFLFKPFTVLTLVLCFFLIGFFLLGEISLVSSFILAGKGLDKRPSFYVFLGSLRNAFMGFRKGNIRSIFLAVFVLIASNIIVIIGIVTRTRIPNYIVRSISHIPMVKTGIGIAVFVVALIVYANLFTLSYFLLERINMKEARINSGRLLRNHLLHSMCSLAVWNIFIILCSAAAYLLLIAAEALFVMLFVSQKTAVAVFLSLCEHANVYAGLCLGWFGLYANISLQMELFLQYKKIHEEDFPVVVHVKTPKLFTDKRKRIAVCVLIFAVFLLDGLYTRRQVLNGNEIPILSSFDGVKITAHRGFSSQAPENTLEAFQAAIDSMSDFVEFDVQQTKDGELIILHDSNLQRTCGKNKFIWNASFEEVRRFDAGAWFSDDYAGVQIPTLEESITLCKGKILMNIEIKGNSHFKDLEEQVVMLIQKYGIQKQCVVQSTDYAALKKVKKLDSSITTGLILMGAYGEFDESTDIDFFSIRSTFVNKNMVESAHKNGKGVYAWTVNTKNEIRRMKVLKVDNIITDRPILARELLYQDEFNMSFVNLFRLLK